MAIIMNDHELSQFRLRAVRAREAGLTTKPHIPFKYTLKITKTLVTEPCFDSYLRLHRLACGHIVHTHQPSFCGRTCSMPIINYAPLQCTLCERWKMVLAKRVKERSSHIADLILPDLPDVHQDHVPHIARARECDIVYPLWAGEVFVPFTSEDIAIVRVSEQGFLLGTVFEMIPKVGANMGWSCELIVTMCESFTACVEHHHL